MMKYRVGQMVYTKKDIRGWFDYLVEPVIPANTLGTVVDFIEPGSGKDVIYIVDFGSKIPQRNVVESDLHLR
jgi:hypothetical protein